MQLAVTGERAQLGENLSYAFDDPQAAAFLAGIADVCAERSYAMTVLPTTRGPEHVQRIAQSMRDQGSECAPMVLGNALQHTAAAWSVMRGSTSRPWST
jgi:hypothetical protein